MNKIDYFVSTENCDVLIEKDSKRIIDDIVDQLVVYRKKLKLTQQDIADATGIKRANIARLELKKNGNNIIIDDAYNSNPVGSKMALDVLKLMDGTKIVVTPGMIELGPVQYKLNKEFGYHISEVVDYTILVGTEQTKPIYEGLIEKKYNKEKIYVINDVREAFRIIENINTNNKKYILLENDLPDIFNEK